MVVLNYSNYTSKGIFQILGNLSKVENCVMSNIIFYSVGTFAIIFLFLSDESGTLNLIYRFDAYLTLCWKWLNLAPGYVRMVILQRYFLWKMRREFKLNSPLPYKK